MSSQFDKKIPNYKLYCKCTTFLCLISFNSSLPITQKRRQLSRSLTRRFQRQQTNSTVRRSTTGRWEKTRVYTKIYGFLKAHILLISMEETKIQSGALASRLSSSSSVDHAMLLVVEHLSSYDSDDASAIVGIGFTSQL
jgi:hypothetical protein